MKIEVDEARPEDAAILRNLGELYAHDFSGITGAELDEHGRYDADFWEGCWGGGKTPYLLRVDGHLAGFAVVAQGSRLTDDPAVWDVAEFFVVRRWRRQGVGTETASVLFRRHPGTWEVRVREGNEAARGFWKAAIGRFTGERFEERRVDDVRWTGWVERFVSEA
jgi:predicted acetyltransferase